MAGKNNNVTTILRRDSYIEKIPFTSYHVSEFIGSLHVRIYDLGCIEATPQFWPGNNIHIDPYTRIYYFTDGEASFTCNGVEFKIKPGRFYLFPSQAKVSFYCEHAYHYMMHCRFSVWDEIDIWHLLRCNGVEMTEFPPSLAERFMHFCINHPGSFAEHVELIGFTYELLAHFWALEQWKLQDYSVLNVERILRALRFIEKYQPGQIKIDLMAKAAGLSRSVFSVEFKRFLGIPPARYLMERRLEKAQRMLLDTNMILEAIADELGFSSAFHLSRAFKKRYNISPREFRLRNSKTGTEF